MVDKKSESDIIKEEKGGQRENNTFNGNTDDVAVSETPRVVLNYQPTSGVKIEAIPGKTTTILGRYATDTAAIIDELELEKSIDFGPRDGGFNLLNVPDDLYISAEQFWEEYNKPWLDAAIKRGDSILAATRPTIQSLYTKFPDQLSGFGREYFYLIQKGYRYSNGAFILTNKGE